ncbi:hypothetical protein K431DRAFT_306794 [Polychaeton citri CBS 116435]|uniref:Myb-like domain-containing protein n=1 Tax=Polychaeton citri CBS 116435 TaxID=1314669 RepID=A0A9P4Q3U1_9PEZI|nr:hypothetical protein K431DRAFT_306794 [Polychaeton citri CBS 116435]
MSSNNINTAITFSEREQQLLAAAWTCMEGEVKVDYTKLANKVGMSNPRSASNAWSGIRKKLAAINTAENSSSNDDDATGAAGSGDVTPAAVTPTKKGGGGRKRKATDSAGDEGPRKGKGKGKGGKAKKGVQGGIKVKEEDVDVDDSIAVQDEEVEEMFT